MTMLERLRGLDAESLSADEMVELRQGARALETEYTTQSYEVPEWLRDRAQMLDREIGARRQDALMKRLKEIDAQEQTLKTASEKRADLQTERERINAALGRTPVAVG